MNKISPYDLTQNPFQLIDKQWALITTQVEDRVNIMTASWGGVGILWNKPVFYIFIRPQRFTREMLDKSETFSLCFLPNDYRKQVAHCGAVSGRDEDKLATCGFEAITLDGAPAVGEAELIITCKKIFRQRMEPSSILYSELDANNYPNKDYHFVYAGEILGVYEK